MSKPANNTLSLGSLTALVVGAMIGAGIFSLPTTFGRATGGLGALIAWAIAGGGMLMLAFVFQNLAERKPHLNAGVFSYAKAGFGEYLGFISALGFWAGTCIGNVSYFVLIKSTLGAFFPIFGEGNTLPAITVSSIILWAFHFLVLRGIKEAAFINTLVTCTKIIPIFLFVVVLFFAFRSDMFMLNFWGGAPGNVSDAPSLFSQVRSTMLVTVFVFLGIEGASIYSRYARSRKDVGLATLFGFIGVLCLLMLVTMLSFGVMLRSELAELRQPSMAGVLESIVGRWGAIVISLGLIVSVLGAYLSWSLLAAEVIFSAAKNKSMPDIFSRENKWSVPSSAVWLTNITIQVFLIITMFSNYAFQLSLELTSAMTLVPYLLVAGYGLKLTVTRETYMCNPQGHRKDLIIALLATIYACLMIYAGGLKYLLLSAIIYAPGSILYFIAKREQLRSVFTRKERSLFILIIFAALAGIVGILSGNITI
ncbi:basic amino acid/polyamine antiporter [Klebsiella sp. R445]